MENTTPDTSSSNTPAPVTPPPTHNPAPTGGTDDIGQHKTIAIIGYIIPLLFFIPLVTDAKHNAFAKFHANQQLNLLLFWVAINIIAVIPVLGWIAYAVGIIFGFVLMIMGAVNAANGRQKELPLIGTINLLK